MVLSNGSKMARLSTSVSNRQNCGGVKKSGLISKVGVSASTQPAYRHTQNTIPQFTLSCTRYTTPNTFPSQSAYWRGRL